VTIDWFTLLAQLLNFTLLLVLLRVFLYRPVLDAMQQREARIKEARSEAEALRAAASSDAEALRRERAAIDQERRARLTEVERELETLREERHDAIEREARALRAALADTLERDRSRLLDALQRRTAALLVDELRAALAALADASLERQAVTAFRRRLETLDEPLRARLRGAARDDDVTITTAITLGDAERAELQESVRTLLGAEAQVVFERDERLLVGMSLTVGGVRVDGSGAGHLEALESAFDAALHELRGAAAVRDPTSPAERGSP
jgi:F-type H+-transporting ATPase subunit b